jgi:hypothetical protein
VEQVIQDLSDCVDGGGLLVGQDAMAAYLRDWTRTRNGEALAVIRPSSTAQVSAAEIPDLPVLRCPAMRARQSSFHWIA